LRASSAFDELPVDLEADLRFEIQILHGSANIRSSKYKRALSL